MYLHSGLESKIWLENSEINKWGNLFLFCHERVANTSKLKYSKYNLFFIVSLFTIMGQSWSKNHFNVNLPKITHKKGHKIFFHSHLGKIGEKFSHGLNKYTL